jgi:Response regulator containing a CheY-like receiver domain and an HTH DNA-binding domain
MPDEKQTRVLSVESDDRTKLELRSFLSEIRDLELNEADNAAQALQVLGEKGIDVALIGLADSSANVALTKEIRKVHPGVRILVLTNIDSPEDIFTTMNAGADGYVLKGVFAKPLEMAIRSVRLGTVWLDPHIAKQVLKAIENASSAKNVRILPTGLLTIPLMPEERSLLDGVASSNCVDGVCMVDPSFVKKLRRFAPAHT